MAPLSKDTADIILPFDTFGSHLNAANKTIDFNLEIKNFEAAGKILAEIWSESIIDNHAVVTNCTSPPEKEHDEVVFHISEEWKAQYVRHASNYLVFRFVLLQTMENKPSYVFFQSDIYQVLCQSQHKVMV